MRSNVFNNLHTMSKSSVNIFQKLILFEHIFTRFKKHGLLYQFLRQLLILFRLAASISIYYNISISDNYHQGILEVVLWEGTTLLFFKIIITYYKFAKLESCLIKYKCIFIVSDTGLFLQLQLDSWCYFSSIIIKKIYRVYWEKKDVVKDLYATWETKKYAVN